MKMQRLGIHLPSQILILWFFPETQESIFLISFPGDSNAHYSQNIFWKMLWHGLWCQGFIGDPDVLFNLTFSSIICSWKKSYSVQSYPGLRLNYCTLIVPGECLRTGRHSEGKLHRSNCKCEHLNNDRSKKYLMACQILITIRSINGKPF